MRKRALFTLAALLVAVTAGAEATRTLRVTLSGGAAAPFAVENLAGTMTVVAGQGPEVTAVATIHAEDDELAAAMRFEQVRGKDGRQTLRVIYPSGHRTVRYPDAHGTSQVTYDGHRIRVSSHRGDVMYAEVEIRVPARDLDAKFRNAVGVLSADGIEGRILLDTASGDIRASKLAGHVKADTGSGDVRAEGLSGSFTCDTGSGDCTINGFDGDTLSCDTGSGDVESRGARASRFLADTGSGRVTVTGADLETFEGDTGSGRIVLENSGTRLRRVDADTGSGGVTVRLPSDAGFELRADVGSGDITSDFSDARAIVHHRRVIGYERGDRRVRIVADTGSGSVRVDPLR